MISGFFVKKVKIKLDNRYKEIIFRLSYNNRFDYYRYLKKSNLIIKIKLKTNHFSDEIFETNTLSEFIDDCLDAIDI